MKLVLGLTAVLLVSALTQADEDDKDKDQKEPQCEGHKKTLQPQQLHKVEGDWVLVWATSDGKAVELLPNVTSSHLELRFLDNKTLNYNERNVYHKSECSNYIMNVTVPDEEGQSVVALGGTVNMGGKTDPFNDNATIDFLHTNCDHCLKFVYKSLQWGRILLMYRREGHHRDVKNMKQDHEHFHEQAKCLDLPLDTVFIYDGKADFCHKKSDECEERIKPLHTNQLHKVDGDWVLVWHNFDGPKHVEDPLPEFASSHVALRLRPNNKSLSYHERNVYQGGKCATFILNFTIPENADEQQHHLNYTGGTVLKDGELTAYNDTATVQFYETAVNHMKLVYNSEVWRRWLLIYRREGHHTDVEQLKAEHVDHKKMAQCLGFSLEQDTAWHYDGKTDFCHWKKAEDEP